jgi:hypothetical protein
MDKITITSRLGTEFESALEQLLFFNPLQQKVLSRIMNSIEQFGQPYITIDNDTLRVQVEGLRDAQTLFALGHVKNVVTLIGVINYVRVDEENIVILHVGITEEYSAFGLNSNQFLLMRLIAELRALSKKIKGVRQLHMTYSKGNLTKIRV